MESAACKIGGARAILVLLDSDDDCPADLGPRLLARAQCLSPDLRILVVLAKREFEAWFLASAESLRGRRGLRGDLVSPAYPEEVQGAKEWLSERMTGNQHYVETLDQPALVAGLDLDAAKTRRFLRQVLARDRAADCGKSCCRLEVPSCRTPHSAWPGFIATPQIRERLSSMRSRKKLIEVALPLEAINKATAREIYSARAPLDLAPLVGAAAPRRGPAYLQPDGR